MAIAKSGLRRSKTVLFEGSHRTGKSSLLGEFHKQTNFCHSVQDRGFISACVFARLFGRDPVNEKAATEDFFANPTAFLVVLLQTGDDYEAECRAEDARRASWSGLNRPYSNRQLDKEIRAFMDEHVTAQYFNRYIAIGARLQSVKDQAAELCKTIQHSTTDDCLTAG